MLASAVVGTCLVVVRSRVTNDLLTHLRQAIEDGLLYGQLPAELRAPGELSMRLTTDAGTLVANIVGAVVELPLAAATLALLGVYGWHMDAALTVIVLGPVPLYFVLPMIMGAPASRRTERARVAQSGALTRTIGAMLLHNVFKLITQGAPYRPGGDWYAVAQRRVSEQSFAGFANASQGWVQSLALLTVVGLGVRDTILHVIPVGTALAFVLLAQRVAPSVNSLAQWPMVRRYIALSWRRLVPYIESDRHAVPSGTLPAHVAVEVRRTHGDGAEAVLRFPSHGVVLITGDNGSGKTTWLHTLLGFEVPRGREGTVVWNETFRVPGDIGYVPQAITLLPGSLYENLCLGREVSTLAIERLMQDLAWPGTLDLNRPCGTDRPLSGGEARRIGIARALIGNPRALILDEPEEGLDQPEIIIRFLTQASPLVIAVTHRPERWPSPAIQWHIHQGAVIVQYDGSLAHD